MFSVESQGAVDVVKPLAPLNHENAQELAETVDAKVADGQPMVVLDMTDVPLIDSAGLESLLDVQQSLQQRGGIMKLAAMTQLCQEVLSITGVDRHFDRHDDVKAAVGSFVQ